MVNNPHEYWIPVISFFSLGLLFVWKPKQILDIQQKINQPFYKLFSIRTKFPKHIVKGYRFMGVVFIITSILLGVVYLWYNS